MRIGAELHGGDASGSAGEPAVGISTIECDKNITNGMELRILLLRLWGVAEVGIRLCVYAFRCYQLSSAIHSA